MDLRTKGGDTRTVLISAEAITIGQEPCLLGLIQDITERKKSETALRQSNERFTKSFHSSPSALSITRAADGFFVDVNAAFLSLFEYRREELIGHSATEFDFVTDLDERAAMNRLFREQGALRSFATVRRTRTGQLRSVLLSADSIELEGEAHTLTTMLDVTARKVAEAALAREQDLLQLLMDNIPDTIYFKDRASRFTRINQAQARVLGVAKPDLAIGKTDADFQASHLASEFYGEEQRLFDTGQPVLDRLEFNPTPQGEPRWFSASKVPLKDRAGQVVGLVGISRDATERVRAAEELRRLNEQLAGRVRELSQLNQLVQSLQARAAVEETYPVVAPFLKQLFPNWAGALYAFDSGRTRLMAVASSGEPAGEWPAFLPGECLALRDGQLHQVDAAHPGQACPHWHGAPVPAFLCVPLLAQGHALGVLHVRAANKTTATDIDESTVLLAQNVADSLALTWMNLSLRETLRQEAIHDPLTGLYNRRFMEEALAREIRRVHRSGRPVRLIMLDLDRFKQLNDRFGHETGDRVLRALGDLLKASSRGGDIACRYGGEEFLLILPDATLDTANERAERVRQKLQQMTLAVGQGEPVSLTASFGVAAYPQHGEAVETVLRAADAALYEAKRAGRNCTRVAPS